MLSADEVKHIALLSRIGLTEEEVPEYQKNLSAVLDFFRQLETVDTENVAPIGHITGRSDVMRGDQEENWEESARAVVRQNMPETKDNFLKVKSVF